MARRQRFHVLIADDGSAPAKVALDAAMRFPWPAGTLASGIVVREVRADYRSSVLLTALDHRAATIAGAAARAMARRWPDSEVRVVEAAPVPAIVEEADRVSADVVVLGWRGHGPLRRLLSGSVSRGVARHAPCAVLTVKRPLRELRRIVIGVDGSQQAARTVELIARLAVPRGGRVSLVSVVDAMRAPSHALMPAGTRTAVRAEVDRINRQRMTGAEKTTARAAATLKRAGWRVNSTIGIGAPLQELLAAVTRGRADLLAIGATGVGGLERLMLGSVAEGAMTHSPVTVLLGR